MYIDGGVWLNCTHARWRVERLFLILPPTSHMMKLKVRLTDLPLIKIKKGKPMCDNTSHS